MYRGIPGVVESKDVFQYNSKNQCTEDARYGEDGSYLWKYVYTYDSKGNLTEMIKYDHAGKPGYKNEYVYK